MRIVGTSAAFLMVSAVSLMLSGCVSDPTWVRHEPAALRLLATPTESLSALDLRRGRPQKFVDSAGWVFGIPRKLLLWDRRVDNHDVGDETMQTVAKFADAYELDGLCVRVNQYDPLGEFSRLRTNQSVAPGWRYTFGTIRVIGYTLVPGRIFGGDQYNPFTNSVYLYSDVPALAVEATAYAKDVTGRSLPGTYAAVNELPFVSIWHETVNVRDAVAFVEASGTSEERADGLRVLHANYGSTVAVATGAGPIVQVGAAVAGQFTGRFQASRLPDPAAKPVRALPGIRDEHSIHVASASLSAD
jgi:hypothetical protein